MFLQLSFLLSLTQVGYNLVGQLPTISNLNLLQLHISTSGSFHVFPKKKLLVLNWFTFSLERLVYYINPHWDPDSGDNGGGLDVGETQRFLRVGQVMLEGQDDKSSNITKKKSIGFFWWNLPSRCVCVRINYTYSTYICFYSIFIYFYIYIYIYRFEQRRKAWLFRIYQGLYYPDVWGL